MSVTKNEKFNVVSPWFLKLKCCLQEQLVVLDFCQATDNPDQNLVSADVQFLSEFLSSLLPTGVDIQINPERDHSEQFSLAHPKRFVDFVPMLWRDDYDPIGHEPREHSFNRQKHARLSSTVVAVENVPVIGMHKPARTR